jgi:hypothetical protein
MHQEAIMSSAARERNDPEAYEHRIPLQAEDREAERALLQKFAEFWSNTKVDLRTTYDRFVVATPLAPTVTFDEANVGDVRGWWDIWEELHHVFQLNVEELASSRRALDLAAAFVQRCFNEAA